MIEKCAFDKLRHREQHVDWAEPKSPDEKMHFSLRLRSGIGSSNNKSFLQILENMLFLS
jgi:hypothetical protein